MYAIVEIAGQQFKVEEGKKIFVHRLQAENGKKLEFDQVLLIEDKGKVIVGEPVIKDAVVEAKVLEHLKGDKVIVFKKKRKKGYRVKNGHRQYFTQVEIVSIKEKAARKKAEQPAAKTSEPEAAVQTVAAAAPEAAEKPAVKKPRAPKASDAEEKTPEKAAQKTTTKKSASKKE
ncbi:MAG: 50S ribosomal protein L21 [Bacteroidales bacterium]|nr:50S ribosomal protein L21 [Bacteroidales bacterium]